ncbi:MAG: hypothetical protein KY476_21450 [Planctomycetes bacterium]|nr:hypothetical protein [Planctomycetota bacterium]
MRGTIGGALAAVLAVWLVATIGGVSAAEPVAELSSNEYRVTELPARLKLPDFYKKYVDAHGYPIVSSERVNDFALKEAAYLVDLLLAERPDVRSNHGSITTARPTTTTITSIRGGSYVPTTAAWLRSAKRSSAKRGWRTRSRRRALSTIWRATIRARLPLSSGPSGCKRCGRRSAARPGRAR